MARRGGDVGDVAVARESGHVAFTASTLPGADTIEDDEKRRQARKDAGVTAILHESHPVRYWDHDLGPDESHVLFSEPAPVGDGRLTAVRDLTPDADGNVGEGLAVSPDGRTVAVEWRVDDGRAAHHGSLAIIDTASGERRILSTDGLWISDPTFSPDGRSLAYLQETLGDWDSAPRRTLQVLDLATDEAREVLPGDTIAWPSHPVFSPDGAFLYFLADEGGRAPVFRLDLGSGAVLRLTASGSYTDLVVSPDGSALFALRSAVDSPPTPVRLDPTQEVQEAVTLLGPQSEVPVPGTLTEVLHDRRGRYAAACLAGAAVEGRRRRAGAAAAVDPWWAGEQLERLVVAVEPVAHGGPRVRRPAAGSRAVDRLRPRVPPARLGPVGRAPVHRPHDHDRRRRGTARDRPVPGRGDGRVVRRLHGQLGRHADRPVPRDRHARQPLAPRRVRRDDRRALLLAQGVRRPAAEAGTVPGELPAPARRGHPHPDAGHPRRQGLPGPHRRGPAALVRPGAVLGRRPSSSTSRTRTTGSSPPDT